MELTVKKLEAIMWALCFVFIGLCWASIQLILIIVATLLAFFGKGKYKQYGINCWEGKDNLMSSQTGGSPDESISSRLGKARERGSGWTYLANKVDLVAEELFNDENHCHKSIERDRGKKQVTTY